MKQDEHNPLIIFSGKLSDESINYLTKFDKKRSVLLVIVLVASMIALAISVSMITIRQTTIMYAIYIAITIIAGIIVLFGFTVCLLYFLVDLFDFPFYKACYFDNQRTIVSEWVTENYAIHDPPIKTEVSFSNFSTKITAVKRVFETEHFYIIVSGWFFKKAMVCQKNLIIRGTLEEFEKIFEGKITQIK